MFNVSLSIYADVDYKALFASTSGFPFDGYYWCQALNHLAKHAADVKVCSCCLPSFLPDDDYSFDKNYALEPHFFLSKSHNI